MNYNAAFICHARSTCARNIVRMTVRVSKNALLKKNMFFSKYFVAMHVSKGDIIEQLSKKCTFTNKQAVQRSYLALRMCCKQIFVAAV